MWSSLSSDDSCSRLSHGFHNLTTNTTATITNNTNTNIAGPTNTNTTKTNTVTINTNTNNINTTTNIAGPTNTNTIKTTSTNTNNTNTNATNTTATITNNTNTNIAGPTNTNTTKTNTTTTTINTNTNNTTTNTTTTTNNISTSLAGPTKSNTTTTNTINTTTNNTTTTNMAGPTKTNTTTTKTKTNTTTTKTKTNTTNTNTNNTIPGLTITTATMVQQARWQRCWFQWCAAVLVLLVGNASMPAVHAFSNGARGCIDMTPVHGVLPQASAVPFSVTFAPQQPRPGEAVTVKIQGNSNSDIVMGFLIVARVNRSDSNHGTFTAIPDTKLVANCQSAALTHSTRLANNVLSFQWTAPATIPSGLLFVATVVKDKSTFWTDIRSAYIKAPDPSQTVSPTTTTTAATTTIETWTCSTRFECSISWQFDNSTQSTEFVFRFDSNQHQYLALGLSTDNKMGNDSVMACMVRGNTFQGRYSYNKGKKNNPLSFFPITNGTFDGGIATCRFNRTNSNTNNEIFDIGANKWYLLAALGSVSPEFDLLRHVYAISTASLVDLRLKNSDQPKSAEEVSGKKSLVLLHGITMIIGWVLFASVGMFVARYSKNINKKLCSLLFWFQIHRLSMVLVLVLTVVGFIAIFVETEGKYSQFTTTTMKAHPPLGLIVTILVIFNPVLGYFRPGKDSPYRVTFNWVHRITGIVAMVFADTTIFIGIMMYSNFIGDQAMQRSFLIEISLFLVYKFIAICVMEGIQLTKRFSASVYEMNAPGQNKPAAIETQKDETLMKLLLLGHIVICVGFTVALSATFF